MAGRIGEAKDARVQEMRTTAMVRLGGKEESWKDRQRDVWPTGANHEDEVHLAALNTAELAAAFGQRKAKGLEKHQLYVAATYVLALRWPMGGALLAAAIPGQSIMPCQGCD